MINNKTIKRFFINNNFEMRMFRSVLTDALPVFGSRVPARDQNNKMYFPCIYNASPCIAGCIPAGSETVPWKRFYPTCSLLTEERYAKPSRVAGNKGEPARAQSPLYKNFSTQPSALQQTMVVMWTAGSFLLLLYYPYWWKLNAPPQSSTYQLAP